MAVNKEKLEAAAETEAKREEEANSPEPTTEQVQGAVLTAPKVSMPIVKNLALKMKQEALKKFKVTIVNQDPKEASSLKSVYVSVANQFLSKAYVLPFNVPINGVEQCIIDALKEVVFYQIITDKDNSGNTVFNIRAVKKYALTIEPLEAEE